MLQYEVHCTVKAATCAFLKFIFIERTIKEPLNEMEKHPTDAFLLRPEILPYDIRRLAMGSLVGDSIVSYGPLRMHEPVFVF